MGFNLLRCERNKLSQVWVATDKKALYFNISLFTVFRKRNSGTVTIFSLFWGHKYTPINEKNSYCVTEKCTFPCCFIRKDEESKKRGRICTLVAQSAVIYRPYSLQFHLMDLKEALCSTSTLVLQNQYSSIKEITFIPLTRFYKDANPFSRRASGHAKWKGASKNEYSYSFSFLKKRGSGGKAILKMACKLKLPLASFKLCDSHLCKMLLEEFLGSH